MLKRLFSPIILIALILAGCQTPQGKFTPRTSCGNEILWVY
ncbi:putative outer membrane lipoprotein [Citrobacter koseri]|uniref:Putative outer membrane lipoprotein n=1 Tax=Citrobacter koseri TaxID=545 RepID=A0A2X2WF28_CITKO|nr:putative outer membrane lipoprotein [Citrobacter koseri]